MNHVHILDVGQGNTTLAQGAGWVVLVDAAPSSAVLEALSELAITRIDRLIVSHRDADHARGVVPLLASRQLDIDRIYISADAAKDPSAPDSALLLAALHDAKKSGRCKVSRDLDSALAPTETTGGGLRVEVLAPSFFTAMTGPKGRNPSGGTMTSNTVSAVVRVTIRDGLRVLLPGDIDHIGLGELRASGVDLSAEILVFPHHGASSAVPDQRQFARDVTEAVRPETVLFSVGRTHRIRPAEDVLLGIFDVVPDVRVACTQLSRGCLSDDASLSDDMGHLSEMPAAGRERCRSCAGSVTFSEVGEAAERVQAHQEYIDNAVPTPMCRYLRAGS